MSYPEIIYVKYVLLINVNCTPQYVHPYCKWLKSQGRLGKIRGHIHRYIHCHTLLSETVNYHCRWVHRYLTGWEMTKATGRLLSNFNALDCHRVRITPPLNRAWSLVCRRVTFVTDKVDETPNDFDQYCPVFYIFEACCRYKFTSLISSGHLNEVLWQFCAKRWLSNCFKARGFCWVWWQRGHYRN